MGEKVGIYLRLSREVVEWLRRRVPARKGSLSGFVESLLRREMRGGWGVGFGPGAGREVTSPSAWVRGRKLPRSLLLVFTEPAIAAVKDVVKVTGRLKFIPAVEALTAEFGGVELSIVQPYLGAPATVMAIELAIAAGVERVVAVGECASISPSARIGDVIVPTWGIREEGTSYHYAPPGHVPRPDGELARGLCKALRERGLEVRVGGVWSTDAFFRETEDKVASYADRGVLGVDMETTAIFTVAAFRGARAAAALVVSDELYGGSWRMGWGTSSLIRAEREAALAALEVLSR
ncbi:hypothetical protein B6U99_02915 [Candidatus Geothermarchaeota archaeon ex4572_27]|nr:MAG: hypothetical protein B6U99_02915 [Candidatus Geothermarchaeota archaeon ex4572_27]